MSTTIYSQPQGIAEERAGFELIRAQTESQLIWTLSYYMMAVINIFIIYLGISHLIAECHKILL